MASLLTQSSNANRCQRQRSNFLRLTQPPLETRSLPTLFLQQKADRGQRPRLQQEAAVSRNHETFDRLILDESIHNLRYVCDRDVSVKKVIGLD